ncbi:MULTISPECIES: YcnI family protein [Nocardioides]|uniref:YcnI family protein n=1 Tax=Nocardioides vastitatis TaxID=2568655 RepID=A0ABW0ZKL1_9ACTN|nr:YcnI family protein [Nocardioides sp.]THI99949.1 DUF1775 domain-containing protein [Nocardioides sp.]
MHIRRTLPALGAGAAVLAMVGLTAAPAAAHVTVTPSITEAGAYTVLTFSVGHGCESSPTTRLTIAMPEEIPRVTPTVSPNWTVEKVTEQLAEPVTDAHGNELTERVSKVVYTAEKPLPDGFRDTVELSVKLPEAAGETLVFPVVQSCVKGKTGWVETAAEGQDPETLEAPAPTLTITPASGGDGSPASEEGEVRAASVQFGEEDGSSEGLAVAGLATGVAGILLGGVALARTRRA